MIKLIQLINKIKDEKLRGEILAELFDTPREDRTQATINKERDELMNLVRKLMAEEEKPYTYTRPVMQGDKPKIKNRPVMIGDDNDNNQPCMNGVG